MTKNELSFQIVGTVRDVSHSIESELYKVETIFREFGDVKTFLVESDSTDDTVHKLEKIREENKDFSFLSLGKVQQKYQNRYERISHCREHYLEYVRENITNVDYIVVVDLDGMNASLTKDSVRKTLEKSEVWDAVFANQRGRYFDIGALRHEYWSPNDCFRAMGWASSVTTEKRARLLAIQSRMIKLEETAGLIPVDSAYGGLGIYKLNAFIQGSYVGFDQFGEPQLDFVTFNLRLSKMGYRLFIDSQLINSVFNSHNASEKLLYRQLKRMGQAIPSSYWKRKIKWKLIRSISRGS